MGFVCVFARLVQPAVGADCYDSAISKGWTSCSEACANEWRNMTQTFGCCVTKMWDAQFKAKVNFQPRQHAAVSVQQTTCTGQHAADNMQRTTCNGQHATDDMQQADLILSGLGVKTSLCACGTHA